MSDHKGKTAKPDVNINEWFHGYVARRKAAMEKWISDVTPRQVGHITGKDLEKTIERARSVKNPTTWQTFLRKYKAIGKYTSWTHDGFFKYFFKEITRYRTRNFFMLMVGWIAFIKFATYQPYTAVSQDSKLFHFILTLFFRGI